MSGIEVAGIALAMFPIVVQGLSRFAEGAQTIKYWRRCRAQLQDYADAVDSQETAYRDTLEALLGDIVQSDDELQLLIADPLGSAWQHPDYDTRLRQRLDRSYDEYIRTTRCMFDDLEKLRKRLGFNTSGSVVWDECSSLERELKKLKVALLRNVHKDLIDSTDKATEKLRRIVHRNIKLESTRHKRRSRRPIANIKAIRKHAASLHHVFISGNSWKCPCRTSHVTTLRLEPRLESSLGSSPQPSFRLLLSTSHSSQTSIALHKWHEIEVKPFPTAHLPNASQLPINHTGRSVKFAPEPSKTVPTAIAPQDKDAMIANICTALRKTSTLRECMGFLVDAEDQNYRHHLYFVGSVPADGPRSKSLGQILANTKNSPGSSTLFRKERLEIAITLASSVLQLDGTKWMKSQWTSDDVYFHELDEKDPAACYRYPFLPWKQCSSDPDSSSEMDSLALQKHFIRSKVLFALGLTLVELCFGKDLKSLSQPEDEDPNRATANMNCAFRLLESRSIWAEMGELYDAVVRRCLSQTFEVRDMSLENEDLQQQVYETVIVPLTEALDTFLGNSKIR